MRFLIYGVLITVSFFSQAGLILNGEYSISSTITSLGINKYSFVYDITNNNQQSLSMTGLDGFYIMVPDNAVISDYITPPPYTGLPGYWAPSIVTDQSIFDTGNILPSGYQWVAWWGGHPQSVYPIGTTASFGFTLDNVNIGPVTAVPITFWWFQPISPAVQTTSNTYYSAFVTEIQGATRIDIPEPQTFTLFLSFALFLLLTQRKCKNAKLK